MKKWRYINEVDVAADYGLATDEYLTDIHSGQSEYPAILKLYSYKDYAVLAGRFQDINAEIDIEKCELNGFTYGRRQTGGGAIIMGADQLGICLTTSSREFPWEHISELYVRFSRPIISALNELGIRASFRSKNDLEVGGKKIAGLGVYVSPSGNIQFHASLLLDLEVDVMLKVLRIPIQKFSDKRMTESIEQRITSIHREGNESLNMEDLKGFVSKHFAHGFSVEFHDVPVQSEEKKAIEDLIAERYASNDWIFQNSPQADMTGVSLKKTAAGLLRTYIGLKGENIKSVLITGDFMDGSHLLSEIEARLKWAPLDKEKIGEIVEKAFIEFPEGKNSLKAELSSSDVTNAIWLASQRALAAKRYTYNGTCYYPEAVNE